MQAGTSQRDGRTGRTPGAMTQAMSAWVTASERVVRVALTRGDRIEIEKLTAETLRIGTRESADLVIRDPRYAGKLFVRTKTGWTLRVPEGVRGKLANGGPVKPIDPGPAREIELAPDARGRLETDEGALLFQLVVPPPAMPAPRLPASVQHGMFGAIDWHFTSITIAVFMLFFGATVMLEAADWPMAASPYDDPIVSEVLINFIEPVPPPDPAATWAQQDPIPETDADPEPDAQPDPAPQPRRADRPRPSTPDAQPSLSQDDIRRGVALTITALTTDDGESGAFTDLIRDGAPTTRHADLFADIEGIDPTASAGDPLPRDTPRCVGEGCADRPGNIRDIIRRPTQVATTGPDEHRPLGDVHGLPMDPIDVGDDFDPAALVRRIRGRSRQIARCYEGHLTRHPDLSGRVDAEVTVMPAGNLRVEIARNTTGSSDVAGCVQRHLQTIRLTNGPDRHPVTLGFPFVFSPQQ